jgi:bifunctional non-homologous end joining protein LigD
VRHTSGRSFSLIQNASDPGNTDALIFFLFDVLHLDDETITAKPLSERKERLRTLLSDRGPRLHYSDHHIAHGRAFYDHAGALKVEGIVSKRVDAPYTPGNRGLWLKVKCLNREEFVVVGWPTRPRTRVTRRVGGRPLIPAVALADLGVPGGLSVMRIVLPIDVSFYKFKAHGRYGRYIITQGA